jgi:uncharacterized phage infection (PIP) family protein YhgE
MKPAFTWLTRLTSAVMAILLVFFVTVAPANAKSLPLDELLTTAGKDFLAEVLDDYAKFSQDALSSNLKDAQKLVNGLAEDLEKAADPDIKASQRAKILKDVNSAKATLSDLALTFKGLATDTDTFDQTLETSVKQLLDLVKGDVRTQLNQNKTTLEQISGAIADLSNSAAKINENNFAAGFEGFGRNITALNEALTTGGQSIKATSALFKG